MTKTLTPDAEKALSFPVGAVSPLWLMFAGAAAAGAAVFWARAFFKPVNLEALTPLPAPEPEVVEAIVEAAEQSVLLAVETTDGVVEAAAEIADSVVEASGGAAEALVATAEVLLEPVIETVEVSPAAVAQTAEAAPVIADDLTKLTGIGPKLASLLAERGVTRFADIAAWTEADVEQFDKDMKLMGRIGREAWIAQAQRLAAAAVN